MHLSNHKGGFNMQIEMKSKNWENRIEIGTHSGIFHPDDVLAVAILCLYNNDKEIIIKRSRDMEELRECNILVDVGEGAYDHHQPGGNGKRENGIPYASCGLVWKDFGKEVIKKLVSKKLKRKENWEMFNLLKEEIDEDIISKVDAEDNGMEMKNHAFSYIENFLPPWYEQQEYDEAFKEVLNITVMILEKEITQRIERIVAAEEIKDRCHYVYDGEIEKEPYLLQNILELPNQKIPWLEAVVMHNNNSDDDKAIDFVIFPYPDGGWAAQCVPPSLEKKFEKRISFPEEWAGQTDQLVEISGIKDATFCHKELFLAGAESKEGVKAMCVAAMKNK